MRFFTHFLLYGSVKPPLAFFRQREYPLRRYKKMTRLRINLLLVLALAFAALALNPAPGEAAKTPKSVRDADNPARQPFNQQFTISLQDGEYGKASDSFQVPAGKRLVIEFVSVSVQLPTGQGPGASFAGIDIPLVKGLYSVFSTDFFTGNQLMRLYIEPGASIAGSLFRSANGSYATSGAAACSIAVSGYYVNLP
jgi:hypothetical protein